MTDEPLISPEWQHWAAMSLLCGESLAVVVSTMVANDMPEDAAATLCAGFMLESSFEAACGLAMQYRKLQSVGTIQQQLLRLLPGSDTVARASGLSRDEFLEGYYALNRPVILDDVCADWRACAVWTPDYLVERLGRQEVEVMTGRESDPSYEVNSESHKDFVPFDEYVAKMSAVDASNDFYLVANNKLLDSPAGQVLWDDFELDARYLNPDGAAARTFLWLGPGGTITPLHHDVMNIMFNQVMGWKKFILIPPSETPMVYNNLSVYSDVDVKNPDLQRFPAFAGTHPLEVSVGPGETLFIPVGWWHCVEALEPSISVTTTSFVFPNEFSWQQPERIR